MKKLALLIIAILLGRAELKAQDYTTSAGVRFGLPYGLTLKHFISDQSAVEGILGWRWGGGSITGLYEKHANAFSVPGLYWFYGAGGHVGFYRWHRRWDYWGGVYTGSRAAFGIDGILGIEYQIQEIPFTVGIDYKPGLSIVPFGPLFDEAAISIRYTF